MKVAIIAGTRPEVIKMAPVRSALIERGCQVQWIATGQHGSLADQACADFAIRPDTQLQLDWNHRTLDELTSALVKEAGHALNANRPHYVLVQGDTASAFSGALAGFLDNIPVGHVEAGLRSHNLASPFPEEGFRTLIGRLATHHFAPTNLAARNLRREGVMAGAITITGNTVVDAVQAMAAQARCPVELEGKLTGRRLVLVTAHRRENWNGSLEEICSALIELRDSLDDIEIVFPVHLNPKISEPVRARLSHEARIHLIDPQPYRAFIWLMKTAYLVLSDSGGVQEEALSFDSPVLIMRSETERPEAVRAGAAMLVGATRSKIVKHARLLLQNSRRRDAMARKTNPFGDGKAAGRIAEIVMASRTLRTVPGHSKSEPTLWRHLGLLRESWIGA